MAISTDKKETILDNCNFTTRMISGFVSRLKRDLELFDRDPSSKERRKRCICKYCFYIDKSISLAVMATSNCKSCNIEMHFGSSNVDVYCLPCSKDMKLCCHCGSDINLKNREKI